MSLIFQISMRLRLFTSTVLLRAYLRNGVSANTILSAYKGLRERKFRATPFACSYNFFVIEDRSNRV